MATRLVSRPTHSDRPVAADRRTGIASRRTATGPSHSGSPSRKIRPSRIGDQLRRRLRRRAAAGPRSRPGTRSARSSAAPAPRRGTRPRRPAPTAAGRRRTGRTAAATPRPAAAGGRRRRPAGRCARSAARGAWTSTPSLPQNAGGGRPVRPPPSVLLRAGQLTKPVTCRLNARTEPMSRRPCRPRGSSTCRRPAWPFSADSGDSGRHDPGERSVGGHRRRDAACGRVVEHGLADVVAAAAALRRTGSPSCRPAPRAARPGHRRTCGRGRPSSTPRRRAGRAVDGEGRPGDVADPGDRQRDVDAGGASSSGIATAGPGVGEVLRRGRAGRP